MELSAMGWDPFFEKQKRALKKVSGRIARVTGLQKNHVRIHDGMEEVVVKARGRIVRGHGKHTLFPVPGDFVIEKDGVVTRVFERKNQLVRGASGRRGKLDAAPRARQVIASNIDHVIVVCGLDRDFNLRRIERYLSLIYSNNMEPVVVLNKADLHGDAAPFKAEVETIAPGVPVHLISSTEEVGVDALSSYTGEGKTVCLMGSSGAGKSSLVNAIVGEEIRIVGEVSAFDGKGMHTTTTRDMIFLASGGMIIDNPGIREIALSDEDEGVKETFSDIEELSQGCRFNDCTHQHEPGCRVKEAVDHGELAFDRLANYLKMRLEVTFASERDAKAADRVERERWREAGKTSKDR